jgi:hypothetical protein
LPEFGADEHVHLMVDQPHGHLGDSGGELLILYPAKLIHVDPQDLTHIKEGLPGLVHRLQYLKFQ